MVKSPTPDFFYQKVLAYLKLYPNVVLFYSMNYSFRFNIYLCIYWILYCIRITCLKVSYRMKYILINTFCFKNITMRAQYIDYFNLSIRYSHSKRARRLLMNGKTEAPNRKTCLPRPISKLATSGPNLSQLPSMTK